MRLHRLAVTAFGPFADRQEVDFDRLASGGLFLLHGPTGAGKTSVLDAICFALFGTVPGARRRYALRSDHAAASRAPEVLCELTVAEHRLEVTRTAAWQRPKRRGTGTTTEPSTVLVRELVDGVWTPVTSRIDEAADLLDRYLGLGADQFTKLVLLPQNDFAAFLRASADDRRPLLQKLFGTDRFAAVEHWLAERRRAMAAETAAAQHRVEVLLARAGQAALERSAEPEEESEEEPGAAARVAGLLAHAREESAAVDALLAELVPAAEQAQAALVAGRRTADLRRRHVELVARAAELDAAGPATDARRRQRDAARSAAVLGPLLDDLAVAEQAVTVSEAGHAAARDAVRAAGADPSGDPDEGARAAEADLAVLEELVAAERRLAMLQPAIADDEAALAAARAAAEEADRRITAATEELQAHRARRDELALTAAGLDDRLAQERRATAAARAVVDRDAAAAELPALQDAARTAVDEHQAAREVVLDLRGRRLAGMAAELAGTLDDGEPCPVCGAAEHPAPASPRGAAVTDSDERAAARAEDAARRRREEAEGALAAAREALAALVAAAGGIDAERAAADLVAASEGAAAARSAAAGHASVEAEIAGLETRLAAAREDAGLARAEAEEIAERLAASRATAEELGSRLGAAPGAGPAAARAGRIRTTTLAWRELAAAGRAATEAGAQARRLRSAAEQASAAAGFPDLDAARNAVLPAADLAALESELRAYDEGRARVSAALADAELVAAAAAEAPDIDRLGDQARAAAAAYQDAERRRVLATRADAELSGIAAELEAHLRATAPLRARFAVVDAVSRAAEGAGDNALKMRLSAYVLAARLEQVAEAATVRLAAMSGGRYALVHTDGPARGGVRSGLGLAVVDSWTGVQRDPATLSGGETFCTSLALALGLADVVQAEAGGTQIETLLVDEGFGSLDDDTLDEVLDVVDGLRTGGRTVGLVSHVADLRDRIPAQLEVVKTRAGSRLRQPA